MQVYVAGFGEHENEFEVLIKGGGILAWEIASLSAGAESTE
jgi:hypothetical protein